MDNWNSKNKVHLIDSPTGTGKTTWMLEYINRLPKDTKIIYITPLLTECQRVMSNCNNRTFVAPDVRRGEGSKSNHLLELVKKNVNVVSTHSLFSRISNPLVEALQQSDYVLVLDEAFNVVCKYDMWKDDPEHKNKTQYDKDKLTKTTIQSLINKKCILVEEDYRVKWIDEDNPQPKYETFIGLCDRNLIYLVDGNLLLWSFPHQVFEYFNEVYILSYQFDYQMQSYYFKYFDVEYDKYHIETVNGKYTLVETVNDQYEIDWINKVRPLINIVDGSVNKKGIFLDNRGKPLETALSKTWYDNNKDKILQIKKGIVTFFANYSNSKSQERLWTCFKPHISLFKDPNISKKNWLAFNCRATNDYSNKTTIAYCVNRYIDPFYLKFFSKRNVILNKDTYALSEMIQFLWRSAIRKSEPITVYIPSERMRNLLKDFLGLKRIEFVDAQVDADFLEDEWDD
jgi:hypothetical protein